jgi:GAF domain-containing protein
MLDSFLNLIRPPVFLEDEDKTRKARYANAIAIAFLVAVVLFETFVRISENYSGLAIMDVILVTLAILLITGLVLLRRGQVRLVCILLVVLIWIATNSIAATEFGAQDASYLTNFAIILMAGLLLGWQASLIITVLSIVSGLALAYAEQSGLIRHEAYPITSFARDVGFVFGLNGVLIYLLINGLENALNRSRIHLRQLEAANTNLSLTQTELKRRTADLITTNDELENRTKKLHAVAEITRAATALRDFDGLLASITNIISRELDYYHVAIFLLDEQKQYAILRSANTEAGLGMVARGYRLPISQWGIITSVAQSGQPRIALDLGADQSSLGSANLPETRSQLALPLKSGNEVIGVLDIQSVKPQDFTETDISTLSILADQVGIALQNALLFEESQTALRESKAESAQASRRAWSGYARVIETKGYHYDGVKAEPLKGARQEGHESDSLLIPVQLRGQTIGRLKLNTPDRSHEWTEDELGMVRATAERVALALEGARLLDEAQKRATREAFLSDMATKLSTSFQLEAILRDTVQELGQTLKNSTVTFQLVSPAALEGDFDPQKRNGATAE